MFHTPKVAPLPGLDGFRGTWFHSAQWDHGHDLAGRRVAVVGTGASAIQVVPAIAERVAHLDVYQRSAPWILPRKDEAYTAEQQRRFAEHPAEALEHRQQLHDLFESTTAFIAGDPGAAAIAAISAGYLEHKVADPDLRARLTPTHPFGCTRTLISSDYYPAIQRDDVELVTAGIAAVTADGIRTTDGVERPVDTIVMCTGFHAADYLRGVEVVGRAGTEIHERWAAAPRAYHGITVPGFPNFFMLYGPNTNQGGNSILLVLEAQAQFVADALAVRAEAGASTIEITEAAMQRYSQQLEADLAGTIWNSCSTYFHGPSGDIVTQLPHKAGWYREATERIERQDFELRTRVLGGVTCTIS
jgi:cation diffusion facilitator CzcD-associated flavoprotein CzcO